MQFLHELPNAPPLLGIAGWGFFVVHINQYVQVNLSMLPTAIALIMFPVTLLGFVPHQISWLNEAEAKQCLENAWPPANHQTMLAVCALKDLPTSR